jgi:hypothetical protein
MDARFVVKCDHAVGIPSQNFMLNTCPRCLGRGTYNAYTIGTDGKIVTVSGVSKLSQQIAKILTEQKRPSGYGFDYSVLSGTITPSTITAVKSEVMRCIQYLKGVQEQEKLEGFLYLTTEEISTVNTLDAFVSAADPRQVFVTVSVFTVAGSTAEVNNLPIRK